MTKAATKDIKQESLEEANQVTNHTEKSLDPKVDGEPVTPLAEVKTAPTETDDSIFEDAVQTIPDESQHVVAEEDKQPLENIKLQNDHVGPQPAQQNLQAGDPNYAEDTFQSSELPDSHKDEPELAAPLDETKVHPDNEKSCPQDNEEEHPNATQETSLLDQPAKLQGETESIQHQSSSDDEVQPIETFGSSADAKNAENHIVPSKETIEENVEGSSDEAKQPDETFKSSAYANVNEPTTDMDVSPYRDVDEESQLVTEKPPVSSNSALAVGSSVVGGTVENPAVVPEASSPKEEAKNAQTASENANFATTNAIVEQAPKESASFTQRGDSQKAAWEADKRRKITVMAVLLGLVAAIVAVVVTTSDSESSSTNQNHPISEQTLRAQNDARFNEILDHIVLDNVSLVAVFLDSTSAQHHALHWIAYNDAALLDPSDPILLERYALAVFFYTSYLTFVQSNGKPKPSVEVGNVQRKGAPNPGWVRKDFWLTKEDHCQWWGVTCEEPTQSDENRHVVGFNITKNRAQGTIPPEIKALEHLKALDLSQNMLEGTLPWQVARMFQLEHLWLHKNKLTGTLPKDISFLDGALELRLENNQLTGPLPTEIGHLFNLQELKLNDNALTGTIPPKWETVKKLRILSMQNNKLSGPIPHSLFTHLYQLKELTLQHNELTGPLPPDMASKHILTVVQLEHNRLSGSIPNQWDNMTVLEKLHLHNNELNGTIPTSIGTMTNVQELFLNDNQLTGSIPTQIGGAQALRSLHLENNKLAGLPTSHLGQLVNLHTLRMFHNDIKGYMPDDVCDLVSFHNLKILEADCQQPRAKIYVCECCTKCY